jgi:hypothetical protein
MTTPRVPGQVARTRHRDWCAHRGHVRSAGCAGRGIRVGNVLVSLVEAGGAVTVALETDGPVHLDAAAALHVVTALLELSDRIG